MDKKQETFLGKVEIAQEAVAFIVETAALKVKEVHDANPQAKDSFTKAFAPRLAHLKSLEDGSYDVDIFIKVTYGTNIFKVAQQVQSRIKEQVLYMCDLTINQVNVHVLDVVAKGEKGE